MLGRAACVNRVCATLLDRRIVEERVNRRVQDLVAEHTRLGRVLRFETKFARADLLQVVDEQRQVHRVFEAVADDLVHQRMLRHLRAP